MAGSAQTHDLTLACREARIDVRGLSLNATNWRDMPQGGKRARHAARCFISVPQFSMTPSKHSVKPISVFRLRGITASVFANIAETKNGDVTFHKVNVQRTYKDGNEFKTTSTFGRDDLPIVQLLTDRAWQFILDTEAHRGRDEATAKAPVFGA